MRLARTVARDTADAIQSAIGISRIARQGEKKVRDGKRQKGLKTDLLTTLVS